MPDVLLVGTPNSGKTALFNGLESAGRQLPGDYGRSVSGALGEVASSGSL